MCFDVDSCCGCINLKVGAKAISVVSAIFSALVAGIYGWAAQLPIPPERATVYTLLALVFAGQAAMGLLFIYAAFSNKPALMWPWLVLTWLLSGMLGLLAVLGAATISAIIDGAVVSFYAVYCLVYLYFAVVVNSLRRQEMKKRVRSQTGTLETTTWRFA